MCTHYGFFVSAFSDRGGIHSESIASYTYVHGAALIVEKIKDMVRTGKPPVDYDRMLEPIAVATSDIPADLLERERRIAEEQVAREGKPEAIRAKIVEGKVRKFAAERALLEQPFVKDESVTIGALVAHLPGARVIRFARFKVGEA